MHIDIRELNLSINYLGEKAAGLGIGGCKAGRVTLQQQGNPNQKLFPCPYPFLSVASMAWVRASMADLSPEGC